MKVRSSGLVAYAVLHHVFLVLSVFLLIVGFAIVASGDDDTGAACVGLGFLLYVPVIVFDSLILYRGWECVQDGAAETTPGRAVGFLFIPIYNLYWNFVAYYGLMKEFNRINRARDGRSDSVVTGLALTYAILNVIPYIGTIFAPLFKIVVLWQIISHVQSQETA